MKCVVKILCALGGVLLLVKLAQVLVDVLYDNYGKKYIVTEETDE